MKRHKPTSIPCNRILPLGGSMDIRMLRIWLALAFLGLLQARLNGATLTAALDPASTTPGEPVTLSLLFQGGSPDETPTIPAQPNLQIAYNGQSSQFSIVNGRTSSSVTHGFTLVASQPGTYVIPAITVSVNRARVQSSPVTLEVTKTPPAEQNALARLAFLKLTVPKTEVYLGETLPVDILLHYISAQEIQLPQLQSDGFTFGKPAQPVQGRLRANGIDYNGYQFRQLAVAAKTGNLVIGPAETELVLKIPQERQQRGGGGVFEMFGFAEPRVLLRRTRLRSDTLPIRVLPLPTANVPQEFSGAVGVFNLSVTAGPTNLTAGDPITLNIAISGAGGFDALALPGAIQQWPAFKTYPPTAKFEAGDAIGAKGVKSFEQIVVPESHEIKEIPAITFAFFDPQAKAYRVLRKPAIALTVKPNTQPAAQPVVLSVPANSGQNAASQSSSLVHIRARSDRWLAPASALVSQPGFLLLNVIPLAAVAAAAAWRTRRHRLNANPRLRRTQQVRGLVQQGLVTLRNPPPGQDPITSFALVNKLLQEAIGDKFDLPAAAITEAVVDEQLAPHGVPPSLNEEIRSLFLESNQARYAPGQAASNLARVVVDLERILEALQRLDPQH